MNPADSLQFLERYAALILPALVIAEQIGIPLPAVPALLAVGALAAHGRVSVPLVLASIAAVALAVDMAWYELGRRRGAGRSGALPQQSQQRLDLHRRRQPSQRRRRLPLLLGHAREHVRHASDVPQLHGLA